MLRVFDDPPWPRVRCMWLERLLGQGPSRRVGVSTRAQKRAEERQCTPRQSRPALGDQAFDGSALMGVGGLEHARRQQLHAPVHGVRRDWESLTTGCTFNNTTGTGVPFGAASDTEMCYQFVFAYPVGALSNAASSLLGVTDCCW